MKKRSITILLMITALFVVLSANVFAATPSSCDPLFIERYHYCPFNVAEEYYLTKSVGTHYNSDGTVAIEETGYKYEFDKNGNLIRQTQDNGYGDWEYVFSYDENNNLNGLEQQNGRTAQYTFNDQLRLARADFLREIRVYRYDDNGRLGEEEVSYEGQNFLAKYEYNEDGRLKSIWDGEYSTGISQSQLMFEGETVYYYDDDGVLKKSIYTSANGIGDIYSVYEFDANGNNTKKSTYDNDGKLTDVYEYTYEKLNAAPVPTAPSFVDVAADAYYAQAVAWATENGVTKGTSETTFSPNQSCTRAQLVTFLWRAAGEPEPQTTSNPFTDVVAGSYYEKAVLWAVEKGITKGVDVDKFAPEKTCTRAQIVTFIYRAAESPKVTGSNPFTDVTQGDYYNAILWAVENGITKGVDVDKFGPDQTCTRAQGVTFLYRGIGLY